MRMFVCRGLRFLVVCSLLALLTTPALAQNGRPTLIPEVMAQRYGLTRAWATRLGLDAARARVHEITLHDGTLISVTDDSSVQAIDAETGRTLWTTSVGRRSYPNTQVGASKSYVALCNGSTLYVLSRADGSLLFTRKVQGTPSAAPAVSEDRIFIPTFAGAIESYEINLEEPKLTPTTYRSKGMIEEPPVLAGDYLIWATHSGAIYSATKKDLTANYRFMSRGTITAGLGYWPPLVYAASSDGYIYAIDERNGKRRWQFSTNYPAREAPVALDGDVYAISETSGMFCLSADRGAERLGGVCDCNGRGHHRRSRDPGTVPGRIRHTRAAGSPPRPNRRLPGGHPNLRRSRCVPLSGPARCCCSPPRCWC